ncbi:MAG TPA: sulfotransferase domain-containing protein [Streptosporangiaceae bacterium]|jgi:hypothetical protein
MTPVRKAAPEFVRRAGRRGYVAAGSVTAQLRLLPDFIVIGAQRCGTTSLFRALLAHPQVLRPAFHKGVNYFDLNYYRGPSWYRGHFPLAGPARRKLDQRGGPLVFESSGYYLYHPFALERIAADLPAVKLVVMLRDPVERAYSAYKHELARGYEQESFERALELEDSRLDGEIELMRRDPRYESFAHRHHSYRHRGHYAEQLSRAFSYFPRDQVHVIDSDSFFAEPATEYGRLTAFLGLRPFLPDSFGRHNARPGTAMAEPTAAWLRDYFKPHSERLAALLAEQPRAAR